MLGICQVATSLEQSEAIDAKLPLSLASSASDVEVRECRYLDYSIFHASPWREAPPSLEVEALELTLPRHLKLAV